MFRFKTSQGCDGTPSHANIILVYSSRGPVAFFRHVVEDGPSRVPCRTVSITPSWGGFPCSIARQPKDGVNSKRFGLRKALGEMFTPPNFVGTDTIEVHLWRYRSWKNRLRDVCDIYTVVYGRYTTRLIIRQQAVSALLHIFFY